MNSELQKSSSFLEYCIPLNGSDPNNINDIKLDNFNLRLRCYNMSELLSKCTCSQDINDKDNSLHHEKINKLNSFIDNQKELQVENSLLQEENKILKSHLNYLKNNEIKLAEFESIKYECEQLRNVLNNNLSGNEFLQDLIKHNEDLIKSNIEAKLKIKHLKLNLAHLKRHSLMEESQFLLNFSDSRNLHSKLNQDFNESLEISKKHVSLGCHQCDALKVNYEHIYDMFMKQVDKHELTVKDVQRKELRIKDLEKELEKLTAQPIVSEEKVKKYKQLIKESLKSIVKKDHEKVLIKNESNQVVNYYVVEMGKLNHKIESLLLMGKSDLAHQNNTIQNLSVMLSDIFDHLSINTINLEALDQSGNCISERSVQFIDSNLDKLKSNWSVIVNSLNKLREQLVCKDNASCDNNNSKQIPKNNSNRKVNNNNQSADELSIEYILNKFDEVKELTEGFRDVSKSFSSTSHHQQQQQIHEDLQASYMRELREKDEHFSPQYIFGNLVKHRQHQDQDKDNNENSICDPLFTSICYDKDSLNKTAYQSFTMENLYSDLFSSSAFEVMLQKIEELGEVIHKYSEIVGDMKVNEVGKIDKSCSAIIIPDEIIMSVNNELVDSFFEFENNNKNNRSKDFSLPKLRSSFEEEKEKFETEIQEKVEIIEELRNELLGLNRNHLENEIVLKREIDELEFQLEKSLSEIEELKEMRNSCEEKLKDGIIELEQLRFDMAECISRVDVLESEITDLQLDKETLSREIIDLSRKYELSERELSECRINEKLVEDEMKQLKSQVSQLSGVIIDLQLEKDNLSREIVELLEKCETSKSELLECLLQNNYLENNLKESLLKISNYETTVDSLESDKIDLSEEINRLSENYYNSNSELSDCVKRNEILETELDELQSRLKEFQLIIDNLEMEKERIAYCDDSSEVIVNISDSGMNNITTTEGEEEETTEMEKLREELEVLKCRLKESQLIIDNLESNWERIDQISNLSDCELVREEKEEERSSAVDVEKLKEELFNAIKSLENMTESWQIVTKFSASLSAMIRDIYERMLSNHMIMNTRTDQRDQQEHQQYDQLDDPIAMMNVIGRCILASDQQQDQQRKQQRDQKRDQHIVPGNRNAEMKELVDRLVSTENDYYQAGIILKKNKEDSQRVREKRIENSSETQSSFNDLTNITSLCSNCNSSATDDSSEFEETDRRTTHKQQQEQQQQQQVIDDKLLSQFKIKSYKDVRDHPEIVVEMLREYKRDVENLKRRLSMRYDENKHLKQIISQVYTGNMYDSLSMKMEKLKEECSNNNENVEKVVKRNSKS